MGLDQVISPRDLPNLIRRPRQTVGHLVERAIRAVRPVEEGGRILHATLEGTFLCNLHCPMCSQWGTNGIGPRMVRGEIDDSRIRQQMDLPTMKRVIDQLRPHRSWISITGGEPLVRPEIVDLIEYISAAGMHVGLTTNGTRMPEALIERLVRLPGLRAVNFSVDGFEADHDAIRGSGNWRKTMTAASTMVRLRSELRRHEPLGIRTNTTLQPNALDHLVELVAYGRSIGLDSMNATHLRWFTRAQADVHFQTVRRDFGYDDPGVYSEVSPPFPAGHGVRVFDTLGRLQEQFGDFFNVESTMTREQTIRYYSEVRWSLQSRCNQPYRALRVRADGHVYFCPDQWMPGYFLGNVKADRIEQIWQGEKAKAFRTALDSHGLWAGCAKCCISNRSDS
ncbi:MAG: radical SAM protein [Thermoplasmata archaeon]|nr:radical SAM protein [Thermoplasmata archaeon]